MKLFKDAFLESLSQHTGIPADQLLELPATSYCLLGRAVDLEGELLEKLRKK